MMVSAAPLLGSQLAQQAVAEQRDRLDVATQPAEIGGRDAGDPVFDLLARRNLERIAHHEFGRPDAFGERVVAFCHAARHLQINRLVIAVVLCHDRADQSRPFGRGMRIGEPDRVQAVLQAPQMLCKPERPPRIDRMTS